MIYQLTNLSQPAFYLQYKSHEYQFVYFFLLLAVGREDLSTFRSTDLRHRTHIIRVQRDHTDDIFDDNDSLKYKFHSFIILLNIFGSLSLSFFSVLDCYRRVTYYWLIGDWSINVITRWQTNSFENQSMSEGFWSKYTSLYIWTMSDVHRAGNEIHCSLKLFNMQK